MVLSVAPQVSETERARSGEALRRLCAWAATAAQAPLPEAIRHRAALVLMDDLGAALAASTEPEVSAARDIELRAAGAAEASVLAAGLPRLNRIGAAVANGMAATWCELDEGYRLAPCHAGACIWPALLAEAEATGATTEAVLQALAVAYDMTARFALAFPFATMSVHPHAAYATIGAVAGVGLLRGLDAARLQAALTGATSMTFAGPYGHAIDGALVRNAWTAASCWVAFRAIDWAQAGIAGIAQTPYDVFSVCFGPPASPTNSTAISARDGLSPMAITRCSLLPIRAFDDRGSLDLHERLGPEARNQIAAIEVRTHPRGLTLTGVEPATVLAAKFSMPHAAAAVARLASGGQKAFSSEARLDPGIAALRRKVTLRPLDKLEPWAARPRCACHLDDGRWQPSRGRLPDSTRRRRSALRRSDADRQAAGEQRRASGIVSGADRVA